MKRLYLICVYTISFQAHTLHESIEKPLSALISRGKKAGDEKKSVEEELADFLANQNPRAAAPFKQLILLHLNKINPQYKDHEGNTLLHIAARYGHAYLLQSLVERHIQINAPNTAQETALHQAIIFNHIQSAQILIALGARLDMSNADGHTALDLIALKLTGSYPSTEYLVAFDSLQKYALLAQHTARNETVDDIKSE